ncbi:MAG: DUF4391 domain-containing protein [Muribaculaceae bacterium]|nr:DUF4391 domain-containing protein [Muribaculaceae bacterium]
MLNLPRSTEVKRPLPKTGLYRQFAWPASQRERFDAEISRLAFTNWISPQTLPAIAEGKDTKEIYVIEITLKSRNFDPKNIILLARSIPQRVVYILRYEEDAILAVYHSKLFTTNWQSLDAINLSLTGLNLDAVWENIVSTIGDFLVEQDKSLTEQIKIDEERDKLLCKIEVLERQMKATKQPRHKRELFVELQKLKQHN